MPESPGSRPGQPFRTAVQLRAGYAKGEPWDQVVTYVQEAERLGVGTVWSAEAWNHDAVTPLAFLAAHTTTIRLGTGVLQAGTRTPALVGMTALTLSELSEGRFVLGLGTSGPQVLEGWHGVAFHKPVTRIREIISIVRTVTAGERVVHDGVFYQLPLPGGEGKSLKSALSPVKLPVYLAALGPRMLELTGEVADGWLGTTFIPERSSTFLDHIRLGAQRAGRSLNDIDLQVALQVHITDDVEQAALGLRQSLAFTLGAMGSADTNFYNESFRRMGYEDIASRVQALWIEGRRNDAAAAIPDSLVLGSHLVGTPAMIRDRLKAYRAAGITALNLRPVNSEIGARISTLGAVLDLIRDESTTAVAMAAAAAQG